MESTGSGKRVYTSDRRAHQARLTRSRIIETARGLLLSDGLVAMTVPLLAKRAGVSPQTVYNSVGGKAEVVKAVYDVLLAGDDDPVAMSDRPDFQRIVDAGGVDEYVLSYAKWCRGIWDRVGPLLGAILVHGPGGDPVLREFLNTIDRERRVGNANSLQGLQSRGKLPVDRSIDELIDAVWALTSLEVYDRLVHRRAWSSERYESWLAAQLTMTLRGF